MKTKIKRGAYVGKKSGRLTVSENITPSDGKNLGGLWLCSCECGGTVQSTGYALHWKKSCGCLSAEAKTKLGIKNRAYDSVTITKEYTMHRKNAIARKMTPMKKEEWLVITSQPCFYCGETDIRNAAKSRHYQRERGKTLKSEDVSRYAISMNGVDRLNPNIGYDPGNVVSCCEICNRMKCYFPLDVFIKKVLLIAKRFALHPQNSLPRDTRESTLGETVGCEVVEPRIPAPLGRGAST